MPIAQYVVSGFDSAASVYMLDDCVPLLLVLTKSARKRVRPANQVAEAKNQKP